MEQDRHKIAFRLDGATEATLDRLKNRRPAGTPWEALCREALEKGLELTATPARARTRKNTGGEKMKEQGRLGMTVKELAGALGIGYGAALRLTRQSGFPTVRIGKRAIVPIEQLKSWLEREAER